jgi:hypothetical protein
MNRSKLTTDSVSADARVDDGFVIDAAINCDCRVCQAIVSLASRAHGLRAGITRSEPPNTSDAEVRFYHEESWGG